MIETHDSGARGRPALIVHQHELGHRRPPPLTSAGGARSCRRRRSRPFVRFRPWAPPPQATPPPCPHARSASRARGGGADDRAAGKGTWTFNLDVGLGGFGFANSLYTNVRPDPSGDLSDNWAESYAKPAISATLGVGESELYGKVSAVGERTFAAPPALVGEVGLVVQGRRPATSAGAREVPGGSENLLELHRRPGPVPIGHGFILWDGAGEGGSRGGFWSNARKAWEFAAIGAAEAREPHLRGFLPRPGRAAGERHGRHGSGARTTSWRWAKRRRSADHVPEVLRRPGA